MCFILLLIVCRLEYLELGQNTSDLDVSALGATFVGNTFFVFALRMARGSRKRKQALLNNLGSFAKKTRKDISNKATKVDTKSKGTSTTEIPRKEVPKLAKNDRTKEVRLLPFRDAVHTEKYFEEKKPRGREGGYFKGLRSVRNLQNAREVNRKYNEKAKAESREQTKQRQDERKRIDKEAYNKLLQVCISCRLLNAFPHSSLVYCCMQVSSHLKIKDKIVAVYDLQQGEKLSDAKCWHILRRVDPLAAFFRHVSAGKAREKAAEMVAQGCCYSAYWISHLAREFISTTMDKRITTFSEDADGNTTSRRVKQTVPKPQYKFANFEMGCKRRVKSIMDDETIRARATVWLRLNKGKKKGKQKLKAEDFQKYLQEDLLKDTGIRNIDLL